MLQFTIERAKGSKSKRSAVLKTETVCSKEGAEECARMVATLLGISETRQQDFLFAKEQGFGAKTYSAVIKTLKEKGLIEVNTGYTRVHEELPNLLTMFDQEGHSQVLIDFSILPNQTSLDL